MALGIVALLKPSFLLFLLIRFYYVHPPCADAGCDIVAWSHTPNGLFTVKSAYDSMLPPSDVSYVDLWKKLWKWDGVSKIRTFMWLMFHNRLPTKSLLAARHISNSNLCTFNCGETEDLIHCLRDCYIAKGVWKWFVKASLVDKFFDLTVEEWILRNIHDDWGKDGLQVIPWFVTFGYVTWNIWTNICAPCHGVACKDIVGLLTRCWSNLSEYVGGSRSRVNREEIRKEVMISWKHPHHGILKFNTDGSCWKNGSATGGGVLRDASGAWIVGFAHNLGYASITHAELQVIFDALCIAKRL